MKTKKNKKMFGGIPVYPGGYSCVFKPQLKCKTKTRKIKKIDGKKNNGNNGISKLLLEIIDQMKKAI